MDAHFEMGFVWSRRRELVSQSGFLGQILASSCGSTDHLHCVEVPVLAGETLRWSGCIKLLGFVLNTHARNPLSSRPLFLASSPNQWRPPPHRNRSRCPPILTHHPPFCDFLPLIDDTVVNEVAGVNGSGSSAAEAGRLFDHWSVWG